MKVTSKGKMEMRVKKELEKYYRSEDNYVISYIYHRMCWNGILTAWDDAQFMCYDRLAWRRKASNCQTIFFARLYYILSPTRCWKFGAHLCSRCCCTRPFANNQLPEHDERTTLVFNFSAGPQLPSY